MNVERALQPARHALRRLAARAALAFVLAAACGALAQQRSDVPYVPTPWNVVEAMLEIAKVGPDDYVIDLGSGDGRIVITAAKRRGAQGFGVDLDEDLVHTARREAERQGVAGRVAFYPRNLFDTDISRATVLTMYLLSSINLQLRPRLLAELRPGTRIVSHDFSMGEWQPDARLTLPVPDKSYGPPSSEIFLWIVPANAAGGWQWQLPLAGAAHTHELTLAQKFQALSGSALIAGSSARLDGARLAGDRVSITIAGEFQGRALRQHYAGRIAGDVITGSVRLSGAMQAELAWRARRVARGSIETGMMRHPAENVAYDTRQ